MSSFFAGCKFSKWMRKYIIYGSFPASLQTANYCDTYLGIQGLVSLARLLDLRDFREINVCNRSDSVFTLEWSHRAIMVI